MNPNDDNSRRDDPDDNNPLNEIFGALFGSGGATPFGSGGIDPEELKRQLGNMGQGGMNIDPSMLASLMPMIQAMMSPAKDGGAGLAAKTALSHVPTPDPAPDAAAERAVVEAFRLADLWLDQVTELEVVPTQPGALTRKTWVERTLPAWNDLTEPVKSGLESTMTQTLSSQVPEEMKAMMAQAGPMLSAMSQSMFSLQIGEAVGTLSGAVLSSTDIGFPLFNPPQCGLISANVDEFAAQSDVELQQVRIFLAVRELAHMRLFARAPWLRGHVEALLAEFAAGQHFDTDRLNDLASRIDPSNLSALQDELKSGLIKPPTTDEQKRALTRLETALALIEGWVDEVSYQATSALDAREQLRESIRRRRATGGPAEKTFAKLVGLELRPRRLRDAAALFANLEQTGDRGERDAVWSHPDMMPTADDLDDPLGYRERRAHAWNSNSDVDQALAKLLDEETGKADGSENASDDPSKDEEQ